MSIGARANGSSDIERWLEAFRTARLGIGSGGLTPLKMEGLPALLEHPLITTAADVLHERPDHIAVELLTALARRVTDPKARRGLLAAWRIDYDGPAEAGLMDRRKTLGVAASTAEEWEKKGLRLLVHHFVSLKSVDEVLNLVRGHEPSQKSDFTVLAHEIEYRVLRPGQDSLYREFSRTVTIGSNVHRLQSIRLAQRSVPQVFFPSSTKYEPDSWGELEWTFRRPLALGGEGGLRLPAPTPAIESSWIATESWGEHVETLFRISFADAIWEFEVYTFSCEPADFDTSLDVQSINREPLVVSVNALLHRAHYVRYEPSPAGRILGVGWERHASDAAPSLDEGPAP